MLVDDQGAAEISIASHFLDEDLAAQSVEPIETLWTDGSSMLSPRPLSEVITVDEVMAEGEVVIVRARPAQGARPADVFALAVRRDLPFVTDPVLLKGN